MSWWGKIIGGTFGFMLGGPLGAMLGAAVGHQFDRGLGGAAGPVQHRIQAAFFTATFSVMGHIAKADGRVSREEIAVAENVMAQMRLDAAQREAARSLFNEGKADDFALDEVLEQFRAECRRRTSLILMFMEIQAHAAWADGRLDPAENRILGRVAQVLGVDRRTLEQILSSVQYAAAGGAQEAARDIGEDYRILGVPRNADDDAVKRAYRKLMNRNHPDKLVAKGMPEEMVRVATEKTQKIKLAYERIKKSRRR